MQNEPSRSGPSEREIFLGALEKTTPAERAAFLDGACAGNSPLRAAVEALLAHHAEDSFLEGPAEKPGATLQIKTAALAPVTEAPGDRIGLYKLREKIGEGGCGVVYVAEQEKPVRRRVALKVIKLGMDTRSVIARFEAERQALAMMDHPNIAKVLDAGATETGRPYFVMELVRGIRITEYCDQNHLSTKERLDLFIKVCQAIQHAHQKGIIHRDIKPSNILVTLHDGVPVPKVIDFGIAKATEGRLSDLTIYTELHQFIGTPAYMSPEQAEMSGLDIDTRSDIYSLGVLLYELLTGRTPFDPKELMASGIEAMRRTIREQEPPRPSTRLSTMLEGELTATAKRHGADAPRLIHLIRGDLDWIVMKSLEKDRTRRYETANGLAADLQRHLSNEPVVARPPSATYRLRKFARRNRLAFAAGSAVAVALLLGITVSAWQAIRAGRESAAARRAESVAQNAARRANEESTAARTANNLAQSRLVTLNVAEGWRRVEEGDLFGALKPFADALQMEEHPPERAALHRLRLASVLQQCPKLVDVWSVGSNITRAVFSPDRSRLLTAHQFGSTQNIVRVWDAENGRLIASSIPQDSAPGFVDWSGDGKRFVTVSGSDKIRVWNAATGQPVSPVMSSEQGVFHAQLNHDGTSVVTVWGGVTSIQEKDGSSSPGFPPQVTMWNTDSGTIAWEHIPTDRSDTVFTYERGVFSPDMRSVFIGDSLFDAASGAVLSRATNFGYLESARFSSDGELLITISGEGKEAELRDRKDVNRVIAKFFPLANPQVAEFSSDGSIVALANEDATVSIFEIEEGRPVAPPMLHRSEVTAMTFSPDFSLLATFCDDRSARVWDVTTGQPWSPLLPHYADVLSVAFDADGTRLRTVSAEGVIRVWDLRTSGVARFTWPSLDGAWSPVAFSPNNKLLAASVAEFQVNLWNLESGELAIWPLAMCCYPSTLTFTPDSSRLFAHESKHARLWNVSDGRVLFPKSPDASEANFHFSKDGKRVLTYQGFAVKRESTLKVFDALTGTLIIALPADTWISRAVLSPDGNTVVARDGDETTLIWNLTNGHALIRFPKTTNSMDGLPADIHRSQDGKWSIWSRAEGIDVWNPETREKATARSGEARFGFWGGDSVLSPENRRATTVRGNKMWLRDIQNGRTVMPAVQHRASIRTVEFSSDGILVATTSEDKTARIWDSATGEQVIPALRHSTAVRGLLFRPDAGGVVTFDKTSLRFWELPKDNRSAADWMELASFFADQQNREQDQGSARRSFHEEWMQLRQKWLAAFTVSATEIDAWERHEAWRAERRSDWSNAVAHLTVLLGQHPTSADFMLRRAGAYAYMAENAAAPRDTELRRMALADYDGVASWLRRFPAVEKDGLEVIKESRSKVLSKLEKRP